MKKTSFAIIVIASFAGSCAHQHLEHTGSHSHVHGPGCGHLAIIHDGHIDYLHDGHLHHVHGSHVDDHVIAVTTLDPDRCTPNHATEHAKDHVHGPNCGHAAVPHGDHTDYLIDGHLHHPHGDHCDDHGPVQLAGK